MKTFTDNADRTWTVTINVDAIKRVRSLVQVTMHVRTERQKGEILNEINRCTSKSSLITSGRTIFHA